MSSVLLSSIRFSFKWCTYIMSKHEAFRELLKLALISYTNRNLISLERTHFYIHFEYQIYA